MQYTPVANKNLRNPNAGSWYIQGKADQEVYR
jgi:hypothetical protein